MVHALGIYVSRIYLAPMSIVNLKYCRFCIQRIFVNYTFIKKNRGNHSSNQFEEKNMQFKSLSHDSAPL